MSVQTFLRCHMNAFEYFGEYTNEVLYDNMNQVEKTVRFVRNNFMDIKFNNLDNLNNQTFN